ncbi:MAG TPA: hypothetical protein VFQ35_17335 [Polyangiaceae bacterium]|nr:hypothetical protein [Polyangiaceae bacterium]
MMRVLMLDTDARLIRAVRRALEQKGLEVRAVEHLERARELTRRECFALVLADSNLISERDLSLFAGIPVVIVSAFLERAPAERLARRARMLQKPFTSAELCQVLDEEVGLPPHDDSLLDVLSRAHLSKSSFALSVGAGLLVLEDGELVHATVAEKRGEQALIEILLRGGKVERGAPSASSRTISRPFRPVMLDALCALERLDEVCRQPEPSRTRGGQP